jgi:RimJ/RimL family protein N-acetyltransferase
MKIGFQLSLVIRLTETGEFIGATSLSPAEDELLETGLWIKEAAHGRGYGRETIAAICAWGSKTFRASGFLYPVVDENLPSRKLAEALGAEVMGTRQRQKPGEPPRTLLLYRIPAVSR